MIRLYTDASFIVRGRKAQIGLAVTVRDSARVISRLTSAYTDPALNAGKSMSGETCQMAELRGCLLGFEHLAGLKAQGWVWSCHRMQYFCDCTWVLKKLNLLRQGDCATPGEAGEVLGLIRAAWERCGVVDLRLICKTERNDRDIKDCDTRSKYARNAWVGG